MASGPSVAIIGGGIAGLVCAARLGQLGINNVRVFDTGNYRITDLSDSQIFNPRWMLSAALNVMSFVNLNYD